MRQAYIIYINTFVIYKNVFGFSQDLLFIGESNSIKQSKENKKDRNFINGIRINRKVGRSGLINCYCFAVLTSNSGHKQ